MLFSLLRCLRSKGHHQIPLQGCCGSGGWALLLCFPPPLPDISSTLGPPCCRHSSWFIPNGPRLGLFILFLIFLSSCKYIPSLPPWLLQLMLCMVRELLGEKKWRGTRLELRICCLSATGELYGLHGLTSRHILTAVQLWA